MSRKEHHVIPHSKGGWDVKKNGGERASAHADTKKEAIKIARTISQNQNNDKPGCFVCKKQSRVIIELRINHELQISI